MELIDLSKDFKFNWNNTFIERGDVASFECCYQISPNDFLNFAIEDFGVKDLRGLVNALTNTKRAIDCQIDTLLNWFGYHSQNSLPVEVNSFINSYQEQHGTFDAQQKLKLLQALEVAPSGLLSQIRQLRNKLEHYYEIPEEQEIANALEIAQLFIKATENLDFSFLQSFILTDNKEDMYKKREDGNLIRNRSIWFEHKGEKYEIRIYDEHTSPKSITVSIEEHAYLPLINLSLALGRRSHESQALATFVHSFDNRIPKHVIQFRDYCDMLWGLLRE